MHGMFKIKVVKVTTEEQLYEYAACVYPQKGETLYIDGQRLIVAYVNHMTRSGNDSKGVYYDLDHVQVMVAK